MWIADSTGNSDSRFHSAGYDTVNLWINGVDLWGAGEPFEPPPCLSDVTEWRSKARGYGYSGALNGYTVSVSQRGVYFRGSLAKYFFGNNLRTLTGEETKQAIESLSDCLNFDVSAAKVKRVDFAVTMCTEFPPANYYHYLGGKPRFERLLSTPDTLYYRTSRRELAFYDKGKEMAAKHIAVPETLHGSNLLRVELRYPSQINSQLKTFVTGATLYERDFYRSVARGLYEEFKTIKKLKEYSIMTGGIKAPKDTDAAFKAFLLQKYGALGVEEFMNNLKEEKTFDDRKYYSRTRGRLNGLVEAAGGDPSERSKELDTKLFDITRDAQ